MMDISSLPAGPSHELAEDTACLGCDYNLRGLPSDGLCPECGTPIDRSLRGNFLRFADPGYVARLASGARLMFWAFVLASATLVLEICLYMAYWLFVSSSILVWTTQWGRALMWVALGSASSVCFALGAWRITTPDPTDIRGARQQHLLWGIRLAALGMLGGSAMSSLSWILFLLRAASTMMGTGSLWSSVAWFLLGVTAGVMSVAAHIGVYHWFSRLAMRVPDRSLARWTRIVLWAMAVVLAIRYAVSWMMMAETYNLIKIGIMNFITSGYYTWFYLLMNAATLALGIWWLILLVRYRRHFLTQASLARAGDAGSGCGRSIVHHGETAGHE